MMPTATAGMPRASSVCTPTFQAWNMLPPVIAEISRVMQKITPTTMPTGARPHSAKPFLATYIGPPCGSSGLLVSR